jgi:hypothetical protein
MTTNMLQPGRNQCLDCLMMAVGLFLLLTACRDRPSTHAEEESVYMADYEAPAYKWGFIDSTGNLVIDAVYDDVGTFSGGLAAVNFQGLWGYIDKNGKPVIQARYRSAWAFHEDKARVKPFDQPDHYITVTGEIISSDTWTAVDDFSEGLARVQSGNTFGYIDTSGKMILPPVYSGGGSFHNGLAVVSNEEKTGLINRQGEEIIPLIYDQVKYFADEKLVICNLSGNSVAYDLNGKEIVGIPGVKMMESDGQLISVRKDTMMYFFDLEHQRMLTESPWRNLIYLGEGRWAGKNKSGYLLLNEEGEIIKRQSYAQINKFKEGIAVYYTGNHWGYMDRDGTELTVDVFGLAWDYKEGFARADFADGIAFLDRKQRLAFYPPPGTMDMRDFSEGLAPVQISK